MVLKEEKKRLEKLLAEAVPLLCKNGLAQNTAFCVQAMIGITVVNNTADTDDLILVCFKHTISDSGTVTLEPYGQLNRADAATASPASQGCKTEPAEHIQSDNNCNNESSRHVENFGHDDGVKQEPDDNSYNTVYNVDDEEYGENDVEYIEDEEQYEGDDTTDAAEYDGGDGEDEYYDDPNYVSSGFKSESGDYDDGSGSYVIKSEPIPSYSSSQQYMSASSSSQSLQQRHNKSRGFHSTPGFSRTPQFSAAGAGACVGRMAHLSRSTAGSSRPPKGRRNVSTAVGSLPRSKLAKSTVSVPADASFQGSAVSQRGMLQGLCRTLALQSEVSQKFICHICHASLANRHSLITHIKGSHLAASLFECDVCGESFKWYMQLHRHRRKYHQDQLATEAEYHQRTS